jgi:hypothetical protein
MGIDAYQSIRFNGTCVCQASRRKTLSAPACCESCFFAIGNEAL